MAPKIKSIQAREIISTGASPTIETKVVLDDGSVGVASAPFGSSAGTHEPVTLVDGDPKRYHGLGMLKAVANVNDVIAAKLIGLDATKQTEIDHIMLELDGTSNLSKLGGNSIVSVSLACARAASSASGVELFEYLRPMFNIKEDYRMPKPMMVIIEGGKHADNSTDFQEYLIVCQTPNWKMAELVREGIEIYQSLRKILKEKGYSVNVGYEGAYAPTAVSTNREPLELITEAIKRSGYQPGYDIGIAMDPAASEILTDNQYDLAREEKKLSSIQLIDYYNKLLEDFSIVSIEDGLGEDDWDNWSVFTAQMGDQIMVMGDDLTVTNTKKLSKAISSKAINSILIKPNQAGTLTEAINTINMARENNLKIIISHRGGGDTADTFIADLSVASNADMIKCGPSRSERTEKYNRLMEIAEKLGK
jgi:enolase